MSTISIVARKKALGLYLNHQNEVGSELKKNIQKSMKIISLQIVLLMF